MNTYHYIGFGIRISSELELPELMPCRDKGIDVSIKIGVVPVHLKNPRGTGILYEASDGEFLFNLPSVGSFYVTNGNSILVHPSKNVTQEELRLFLLGTCIGAVLHQRGLLPIHGSSIKVGNEAIVIVGGSTSGKSTLAAGFLKKGYSILCDDISVLTLNEDNLIVVNPGIPHLKLWADVIEHLDYKGIMTRVRPQIDKYRIQCSEVYSSEPIQVNKIIQLSIKNESGYSYEKIKGIEKFYTLRENTFRVRFVESLGQTEHHFNNIAQLASSVSLFNVKRPSKPLQVLKLVDYIEGSILQLK